MSHPLIIIPARMAAQRLPNKPIADIAGEPMIAHVYQRAREADIGAVLVATDSEEIAAIIRARGGKAVMTRADHASGSDRIYEALLQYDSAEKHDIIINVQGDLPTLDPTLLSQALVPLADSQVDIATLASPIIREEERGASQVVKVVSSLITPTRRRALYFTRATAPWGEGELLHHIGLYAYRRAALARFVSLPPSPLELREKLEQLRALEANMRMDVMVVKTVPLGVDTPEDLARAREILSQAKN